MSTNRVFVAGGASFNTMIRLAEFPQPHPQTVFSRGYHEAVGGTGVGKALNLTKLGLPTTLHAMIGADDHGRLIKGFLSREGVAFVHDIDPQGTERHVNLMADDGRRISIYMAYATFEPELSWPTLERLVAAADHVVLNIANYCRRLIPVAQRAARSIWCDLHDWDGRNDYHRDFVDAADRVFLSSDSMPDYRGLMRALIAKGKQLVVCTHGRSGSSALDASGEWIDLPIVDCYPRVDSNGAGDAFFAGFLYGHARGCPLRRCMRIATLVSGLCVTSRELACLEMTEQLVASEYRRHYGETL
jgi:sugar/nucleoside kinase (ribokinase family)